MAFVNQHAKLGVKKEFDLEIPLNTPWTFWIDRTDRRGLSAEDYERNLKKIYTVNTVQKFWQVFNNIPDVKELECNFSYHLMRHEYRPIREDVVHHEGGAWRLKCRNRDTPRVWKELMLAAIGEQLTDPSQPLELLGVSVALRDREDMIQLWHGDARTVAKSQIIKKLHENLPDVSFTTEFYKAHQVLHANNSSSSSSHHNPHRMRVH